MRDVSEVSLVGVGVMELYLPLISGLLEIAAGPHLIFLEQDGFSDQVIC